MGVLSCPSGRFHDTPPEWPVVYYGDLAVGLDP